MAQGFNFASTNNEFLPVPEGWHDATATGVKSKPANSGNMTISLEFTMDDIPSVEDVKQSTKAWLNITPTAASLWAVKKTLKNLGIDWSSDFPNAEDVSIYDIVEAINNHVVGKSFSVHVIHGENNGSMFVNVDKVDRSN